MTPVPAKLGALEDIEHDLHAVSGELYGTVVLLLKRATTGEKGGERGHSSF